ncbi:MAG: MBL fold metallo-hydrolase [Nocardioides sp.]
MIRLTWLGHATVVIDMDGVRLLTDPLLGRHAGFLRRPGGRPDEASWRDPDAVLISHLHLDHADLPSLRRVRGTRVLTAPVNARWVTRRVGSPVADLGNGVWTRVPAPGTDDGGVEVRLVRADHGARPMPHRPNASDGHLIRGRDGIVWFAGDTSLYPEMAGLPELAGGRVDVALLPIAGWGPRLSAGHMGPAEAVEACLRVRPRAVLPIHYGTLHPPGFSAAGLGWMHRPLTEFTRLLAERSPETGLLDVPPGESTDWPV